ncbi:MAG: Mur ligase domain-containing protein [Micropruina sp.]
MRERTIREVAALAGAATPIADGTAGPDVVIDSRLATPGAVFVALPGEHADGHDFVAAGRRRGSGGRRSALARPGRRWPICWCRTPSRGSPTWPAA